MIAKATLGLACLLCAPLITQAHMNPHGDISPHVEVKDGNFSIDFISREEGKTLHWNMTFSNDGKPLLLRHRVATKNEEPAATANTPEVITSPESSGKVRFALERTINGQKSEQPLSLDPVKIALFEKSSFSSEWVGFTWCTFGYDWPNPAQADSSPPLLLMFSTGAMKGSAPGRTVHLGEPATITGSPVASTPVWAAGRWWVAWVRETQNPEERKNPLRAWETILTSIHPATGKLEHKRLDGLSHWNTNVSMKAAGGWLCIAWNATTDGSYPGVAKIITAFEKLPEE